MSFSFSSLVRLIVMAALGATLLAIGLSRLDPPKPARRIQQATRYYNINEYFADYADRTPRWIDAETGRIDPHPLEDGDVLEAASCSPWSDEKGRRQVAGRWSSRTKMGPLSISTDFGLARYSFPDGKLLDHVSTDIIPVGPPCWFPGLKARILFAGGDGELYHYAFESDQIPADSDLRLERDLKPILLKWRCPRPGRGKVFLSDLTWPEGPKMSGYVVVSLREQTADSEALRSFTRTTLWWLKLDVAGTEIVEAGPLLQPGHDFVPDHSPDQRLPTVGNLPGGHLALAYLSEGKRHQDWELRIAPIEFEGNHQIPRAFESKSLLLSDRCEPSHPSFSADGRWLNAMTASKGANGRLIRLPIDHLFAASK